MKKTFRHILSAVSLSFIWAVAPCAFHALDNGSASLYAQATDAPEGSTAYYELNIRDYFKKNNLSAAKALLDQAIKKYPQMSAFHELMGKYYSAKADLQPADSQAAKSLYDKARYYLIRAINIDEKNVQARFLMLHVETQTKHYSSAIVYCNDLLEENPYNEDLWRKKIELYRLLGNNAEADRLLERLYTIYPGDDQLKKDLVYRLSQKALLQGKKGDYKGQEQTLRQLVEHDPKNAEYHRAFINLLYRTGRTNEAAEAAGHAAAETLSMEFVEKRASMLCEMNRHREAVEYVRTLMSTTRGRSLTPLLQYLENEAANAAQYNDSYISYAKIYESHHSSEALNYLVNTSIQRWYLDDALYYVNEAIRVNGASKKMLYNQYLVTKRLGHTRRANKLLFDLFEKFPDDEEIADEMMLSFLDTAKDYMDLNQYGEAASLLEQAINSKTEYIRDDAFNKLYTCYIQTKQFAKAEKMLSKMDKMKRITQTAYLYNAWGKPKNALDFLAKAYRECPETDTDNRNLIAYSYEEIAVPYIKNLLANNRVNDASKQLKEAIEICPQNIEIIRYGITAAQRKHDVETVAQFVARGRALYPTDPYFILKDAQMRQAEIGAEATLRNIIPLLTEYSGDSLLISIYTENNIELAREYLKEHHPEEALLVLNAAIEVDPGNAELYYYQAQAYEQLKDWDKAYESLLKYNPKNTEVAEYKHHLEELMHHTLRNSMSFEYQQARPGSEDVISGNAYLNYGYKYSAHTNITAGLAYAGRDGATSQSDTEMTHGGTGVQLSAGYEHDFTARFSGKIEAAVASRYFPIILARLTGTYTFTNDWQLSAFASYRMLRSYSGIYGWQKNIVGYENKTPVYGDPEFVRTGWKESKNNMFQVGLGLSKTLNNFELSGGVSGLMFSKKYYFNSNLKMQFFPQEGNSSNIFAVAGIGTAPESSLIDRSMPVGFNKVNTFVGMGGSYFVNRHLTLMLSGTWYTMLSQSERLTTTYIANDPYIREDYRNYFYIHAGLLISF